MNFGYLIIVSTSVEYDYLKMAYAAAISIKNTQKQGYDKVALVIDDADQLSKLKSPWVFDEVIEWKEQTGWDGRSWMDKLSPWENTICIDADMLFLRDYSHWVDYFIKNCSLYIPNNSYTYRGMTVVDDFYRKAFTKNNLPNLYSFFTYFKKHGKNVSEFFTLNRYILKNPKEFSNCFLSNHVPTSIGTDEAFALASEILDISHEISYDLDFPRIVHLKSEIQDWPVSVNNFIDYANIYFYKSAKLKLENFLQHDIVHYVDKRLMTDEYISILEEVLWKK
jgi:hypothetical protein